MHLWHPLVWRPWEYCIVLPQMLLQFFLVLAHSAWRALDIELSEFSVTSTNIYYSIEVLEQYEICTMFYTIFYKYTGVEPILGQILISFYLGMLKVLFLRTLLILENSIIRKPLIQ